MADQDTPTGNKTRITYVVANALQKLHPATRMTPKSVIAESVTGEESVMGAETSALVRAPEEKTDKGTYRAFRGSCRAPVDSAVL